MDSLIGQQIEHYRIEALLGEGGMGAVYRALDMNLARPVALKIMHRQFANQPQFQQRFMQEAQAAARLSHPSIVIIHNFDNKRGLFYIVMEYIQGLSLGEYIKQLAQRNQVVKLNETLAIIAQVADALGYAHRQGVVHRDVKPDNILIKRLDEPERPDAPPLRAVVTDFGLAKLLEGGIETQSGTFMGTLPYMSPEQALAQPIDGRSDIYSLGVVLYQLATGKLPFDIKTPTDAVMKHMNEVPPEPRTLQPGLPTAVEQVIVKSLEKKPEDRYQTAGAFARALRQATSQLTDQDVTTFATQENVVSFMTRLQSPQSVAVPSRMDMDETATAGVDRVIISHKGHTPRPQILDKDTLVIGRADENDIVLPEQAVSRQHARLERSQDGWRVVDLGSTNGTFLEGNKLLPDVPEEWLSNQTLRIGPFFLQWKPASKRPSVSAAPGMPGRTYQATSPMQTPAGGTQIHSSTGQLSVIVNPTNVDVAPGQRAEMQVELFNQGMTVDHFQVQVQGLPSQWVTIAQDTVQLMPGARGMLPVTLHPPQESESRSGQHRYRLVVSSTSNPQESAAVSGSVNVTPFEQFSVDMRPKRLQGKGVCRVLIRNEGNYDATFTAIGRDPGEAIRFDDPHKRVQVGEGERGVVDFNIEPKKRPFLGRGRTLPFEIQVGTAAGERRSLTGQLEVKPIIPPWLPPILGGLLLLLCLVGAGAFVYINQQNAAATATAEWLAQTADDDGDGLPNVQEATLGTDPGNSDSDGDGLSDGAEANGETDPTNPDSDDDGLSDGEERDWGTNPLVRDSDGDSLPDGEEVHSLQTSPINPDTDGDGMNDNVDADPGSPPTHTPTPTTTATATGTPTQTPMAPTDTPTPTPTVTDTPPPPVGVWDGAWESQCNFLPCSQIELSHVEGEDTVSGTFADGDGRIVGIVEDNRLTGTWTYGGENGTVDFWLAENGQSWQGNWNKTQQWCGFRPGQSVPDPCGVASWYGEWTTDCSGAGCGTMTLTQDGAEVEGSYADGNGTVEATAEGVALRGQWFRNDTSGSIAFFALEDGQRFNGNYNDDFAWCGHRSGADLPETCLNEGIVTVFPFVPAVIVTLQPILPPTPTP